MVVDGILSLVKNGLIDLKWVDMVFFKKCNKFWLLLDLVLISYLLKVSYKNFGDFEIRRLIIYLVDICNFEIKSFIGIVCVVDIVIYCKNDW